jgi:enoyl-CoA hydratase/carnithine racemase
MLIAAENATFGLPEVDVGLLGGARHFMRLFGNQWTRYANLTARRISANEAYRLGAVIQVVPADQLMDAAMDLARIIAEKSPIGVRMAKANLNLIENMDLKNGYRFEQTQTAILQKTEDALEAKRAWAEKRKPVWQNR